MLGFGGPFHRFVNSSFGWALPLKTANWVSVALLAAIARISHESFGFERLFCPAAAFSALFVLNV